MRFFKLTHPYYATDQEDNYRNPVRTTASHRIPGMACGNCGTWSSSWRLRKPFTEPNATFRGVRFLPVDDWKAAVPEWAAILETPVEDILPGAKLGYPEGICVSEVMEDCVHPIPGEIWIKQRVKDALSTAGLTGVSFAPVSLQGNCDNTVLWELVVSGRAWRKGSTEESLHACDLCGRRIFPHAKIISVDESRWDGSDFVLLDYNPNIIVVTERVAAVLERNAFSNIKAEPLIP